jgi:pyridoxamine 5'-phosphate oxidase
VLRPSSRYILSTHSKMLHSASLPVSQEEQSQTSHSKLIFAPAGGAQQPPTDGSKPAGSSAPQALQYTQSSLSFSDLDADPITQFHKWFTNAQEAGVYQPETVCLSTASLPTGAVSARMVFLKELDDKGFVVYSNWGTSRKSEDLRTNPQASLTFWWHEVERQVRVEGKTEFLKTEESQVYYDTRARGSRIGAWASEQSKVLQNREELEQRVNDVEKRFEGKEHIPVPPFWGGMRVIPCLIEFWQGRNSRLHDRFRYTRNENEENENKKWIIERLSP